MTEADFVAANKKGPSCFRCRKNGHFLNDCETILCDCCQRPDHAKKDCPLHKEPRPRLAMYGMGHPDLAFGSFLCLPRCGLGWRILAWVEWRCLVVPYLQLSLSLICSGLYQIIPTNGKCNKWRNMCSESIFQVKLN
jgi:hypothetical protein